MQESEYTYNTTVSLNVMSTVDRSTCMREGVSITWFPMRNKQNTPKWVWLSTFPCVLSNSCHSRGILISVCVCVCVCDHCTYTSIVSADLRLLI